MNLPAQVMQRVLAGVGSIVVVKKTLTSSAITTAALDLSSNSVGEFEVLQVIVKTDATGLAGGTNFVLSSTNAKGVVNLAVETVANLGANITKSYGNPPAGDTTTSDGGYTVTQLRTVLESGKKFQYNMTASAGTGAGTADVYIILRRLTAGAFIKAV